MQVQHISGTPVMGATYTVNGEGEIIPLDFKSVSRTVMPSVVHIKSTQVSQSPSRSDMYQNHPFFDDDMLRRFFGPQYQYDSPQQMPQARVGSGSGVIISEDGYIVTNNHVIEDADDIEIILDDNRTYKATVVGADPSTDLALLQIKEKGLPALPLVNSDKVEVGEWVMAVGNPFNLNSTVTAGIVSAKGRNINILQDQRAIESFIQTDAAINPGNSGGALVDLQGGLIGINTAIASPTGSYAGYGFAIPSNIVSKVVEDLLKYGMVQRGYLGLMIRSVDGTLAKEKDLDVTKGVYVDSVTENSAAGEAGIQEGDVILAIDDARLDGSSQLLEIVGRHRPGDELKLKVDRKGKEKEYSVTLRNLEGKETLSEKAEVTVLNNLGISVEKIDKDLAKKLNIHGGLKVTDLEQGLLSRNTNIREGFIITKVDGTQVTTVDEFTDYLNNAKGGVMLEGVYEGVPGTYYYAFGM